MAEQSYTLGAATAHATSVLWDHNDLPDTQFDDAFKANTADTRYPVSLQLNTGDPNITVLRLNIGTSPGTGGAGSQDLSTTFENNWSIQFGYGGSTWRFDHSDFASDSDEPYTWQSTTQAVNDRADAAIAAMSNNSGVVVTFRDFVPVAPSWTDATGDAFTGTVGQAITDITVPAVDAGNPPPTYAVVGTLPDGLNFDTTTRVISGTPAGAGEGTITIRATNSQGTADWTVDYAFEDQLTFVAMLWAAAALQG